jgi:hypothetical protein
MNDKVTEQGEKKKHTADNDGHTRNSGKDKQPRSAVATKTADNNGTSTVSEPSPPKRAKQKATAIKSTPDEKPAATNEATSVAAQERARTAPVTAPQAKTNAEGTKKTKSSSAPTPAAVATNPPNITEVAAGSSPASSAANKPKKSPLPHAAKKTSPIIVFIRTALHNYELLSVTSAEDWTAKTGKMTRDETEELTNRMAAFVLSLGDVDPFVSDKILPNPTELQGALRHLLATSERIAMMKDFVQPLAVTKSGKSPAGFHGKGLNAIVDMLDDQISAIALWQHLRGALSDYYNFVAKTPEYQWHALAMAIMATLTVYQIMVNKASNFFPGTVTADIDSSVEAQPPTDGSHGAGSSRSATTSQKHNATVPSEPATRSGGSDHTPRA